MCIYISICQLYKNIPDLQTKIDGDLSSGLPHSGDTMRVKSSVK